MRDLWHRLRQQKRLFVTLVAVVGVGLWALLLSDRYRLLVAVVLLALAGGGYLLCGALTGRITRGVVRPGTARWLAAIAGLGAIAFVVPTLFTRHGPFKIEQPVAWELYPDRIRYRFPRGRWHEHPARDLRSVTPKPLSLTARVRVDGVRVQQDVTHHVLLLEFTGGKRLCVGQERAFQFGESPERLHEIVKRLYS